MAGKLIEEDFIPPEFDLRKYEVSSSFEAKEWLTNLVARLPSFYDYNLERADVYGPPGSVSLADEDRINTDMYKFSDDGVLTGIEYPDILCNDINLNIIEGGNRLLDADSATLQFIKRLFSSEKVSSLTVGGITALTLGVKSHPELRDIFVQLDSRDDGSIPSEWLDVHLQRASLYTDRQLKDGNPIDYIEIDLRKPNRILEDEFSIWLKQKRKDGFLPTTDRNKYITKAKFRNWHDARILPYIDLLQWNQKNGRKLSHRVAGDIIYSDMSDNDLRLASSIIADTTLKNMKEALSRETLTLLALQTEMDKDSVSK